MKKRYRIVQDIFAGFEVQYKLRWWPFWIQAPKDGPVNTFDTVEEAEQWVRDGAKPDAEPDSDKFVKYLSDK